MLAPGERQERLRSTLLPVIACGSHTARHVYSLLISQNAGQRIFSVGGGHILGRAIHAYAY